MTDLPPMVPSAKERLKYWPFHEGVSLADVLDEAYRDGGVVGQQSRQPEIDALRAALDEAERALELISVSGYSHRGNYRIGSEEYAKAALARIREVKS